jgi:hypothetical protein
LAVASRLLWHALVTRALTLVLFVAAGCGPAPLPAPCPPAVESAEPTLALGDGGATFEYGAEGLPEGRFVRRFDADGALSWTVAVNLPQLPGQNVLVAAGDTAFVVDDETFDELVIAVRDGAIAWSGKSPFDCRKNVVEPVPDGVRVWGRDDATASMCSYHVSRDGSFDDLVRYDAAVAYNGHSAPGGGFVVNAKEGLVGYDAAGVRRWSHAGSFAGDLVFGGGAIWTFRWEETSATLVRVGLDGQGEDAIRSFAHDSSDSGNSHLLLRLAATSDGVIAAVEHDYKYQHELVRADGSGLVWSSVLDSLAGAPVGGIALGSGLLLVRGKSLAAFDLDGNPRWLAPSANDAVIGADDRARVADNKTLDACRSVLRVSMRDSGGSVQSTWSAR